MNGLIVCADHEHDTSICSALCRQVQLWSLWKLFTRRSKEEFVGQVVSVAELTTEPWAAPCFDSAFAATSIYS